MCTPVIERPNDQVERRAAELGEPKLLYQDSSIPPTLVVSIIAPMSHIRAIGNQGTGRRRCGVGHVILYRPCALIIYWAGTWRAYEVFQRDQDSGCHGIAVGHLAGRLRCRPSTGLLRRRRGDDRSARGARGGRRSGTDGGLRLVPR